MLGFSPVSSRAISGSPFSLVLILSAITATGTLTFSGSARWGAFLNAHATGELTFGGSAKWSTRNALSASSSIVFGGSGILQFAGRPIVFFAIPDRHSFIASADRLTFSAIPDNFTFRGMR